MNRIALLSLLAFPNLAIASHGFVMPFWTTVLILLSVLIVFILLYKCLSRLEKKMLQEQKICPYCRHLKDPGKFCTNCNPNLFWKHI